MIIIIYLVGLLIGIGFYLLTHFFSKEMNYKKRMSTVSLIGILIAIVSFVIGGFSGMGMGILSGGILTVTILMTLFGKKELWRKYILATLILFVASSFTFFVLNKIDYWIIEKAEKYAASSDEYPMNTYLTEVQNDTNIRGYKIFDIVEDKKAVVLSLGKEMSGNTIEVLKVEEISGETIIYVKSYYNKSTEKNPKIIIGLNRLNSQIKIKETDGTSYKEVIK